MLMQHLNRKYYKGAFSLLSANNTYPDTVAKVDENTIATATLSGNTILVKLFSVNQTTGATAQVASSIANVGSAVSEVVAIECLTPSLFVITFKKSSDGLSYMIAAKYDGSTFTFSANMSNQISDAMIANAVVVPLTATQFLLSYSNNGGRMHKVMTIVNTVITERFFVHRVIYMP